MSMSIGVPKVNGECRFFFFVHIGLRLPLAFLRMKGLQREGV